jgi:predicted permease
MTPVLQETSRGTVGVRHRFAAGGVLVVAQVALSMLLLTAAALLVWSAQRLQRVDPGFDAGHLLTFSVDTSLNGYDTVRSRALVARALDELRAVPGVASASITNHRLIANSSSIGTSRPEGSTPMELNTPEARAYAEKNRTWRLIVDDRFFATFRIPLLRGRALPPTVAADGPRIAVVNEALAQQLFGTTEVIGRRFIMGLRAGNPVEIVGVAANARYTSLRTDPPPTAYFPYQQAAVGRLTFAVRAVNDPLGIAASVREAMRRIDDTLPLVNVRTQEEQIRRSLAQERLFANLALLLGAVTLALSGIGLYGLLAYAVTRRTPEIGVRIALGAERRQVRWMILKQSLVLMAAGLAIGIPGSMATASWVQSLLFGLSPNDPRAIAAAAGVLLVVAFAAAYFPARRASRIDPLSALRAE